IHLNLMIFTKIIRGFIRAWSVKLGANVIIHSDLEAYLFLLLSMWPVLIVVCVGMALAFNGVLMRKTAILFMILAISIGLLGWLYA
ncbi:hypothetical protein, partial [Klebsiella aerogenes]|uniref:hypothetical protein n=1 Tax=Klebsiella aerogenes TaxID=548 RepID=UPI000693FAFF